MSQYSLFETTSRFAGLASSVKAAMHEAAAECGLSRDQVADRMNEVAGRAGVRLNGGNAHSLQVSTLEKWLNPKETGYVPSMLAVAVFCQAVRSLAPVAALAHSVGGHLINDEQAKLLRVAEIEAEMKRLKKEKKRLEAI